MFNAFSPDGMVTFETCPVVSIDGTGNVVKEVGEMKRWHCPECSDSLVMVA